MLVTRTTFADFLGVLKGLNKLSLDTETTGLKPYQGDKIFSVIMAGRVGGIVTPYYLNFNETPEFTLEETFGEYHKEILGEFLSAFSGRAYLANAKYDLHMLFADWKVELSKADIFCTEAQGRVAYNDHFKYGLADSLERIGLKKDNKVKEWLDDNDGFTKIEIEGKAVTDKKYHFEKVPRSLIVPYAEGDAVGTFMLGEHLERVIKEMSDEQEKDFGPSRTPHRVSVNESRLTKTLWRMERQGILIDKDYTRKGFEYEQARNKAKREEFERATGLPFIDSSALFSKIFAESDGERFGKTKIGNASFKSDFLETFLHPAAQIVLDIRDSKSKSDFYTNFLRFADSDGFVHGNFKQGGTRHGRMSASDPNLQNFSNPDEDEGGIISGEYNVRGCVIAPPDYYIVSIDYDAMEYRFLLELAAIAMGGRTGRLLEMMRDEGVNPHKGTAKLCQEVGLDISYKEAKISNFLTIFGGSEARLAAQLKTSLQRAVQIRQGIFRVCPEMLIVQNVVRGSATNRGYVVNWMGRRSWFPGGKMTHKALNYVVSGGCADVNKIALNSNDEFLMSHKSKLVLSIHDENDIYVYKSERGIEEEVKNIMEKAYPHKYIPLTASISRSQTNLAMVS